MLIVDHAPFLGQHQAPLQLHILVVDVGASPLHLGYEVTRRVHLLHDASNLTSGSVILLSFELEIMWQALLESIVELLVLQEGGGHDSIDLFEVLENRQPRILLSSGHVLVKTVVAIDLWHCSSILVEGIGGSRTYPLKELVTMDSLSQLMLESRGRTTEHEGSLAKELGALLSALDLLVVIQALLLGGMLHYGVIGGHHLLEAHHRLALVETVMVLGRQAAVLVCGSDFDLSIIHHVYRLERWLLIEGLQQLSVVDNLLFDDRGSFSWIGRQEPGVLSGMSVAAFDDPPGLDARGERLLI